jgi:hypothetical protein
MMKSGLPPVSTLVMVWNVLLSTMLALFSRPLLVKTRPPGPGTAPWIPGVSAISPTIASVVMSYTTTFEAWLMYRRLAPGSTFR